MEEGEDIEEDTIETTTEESPICYQPKVNKEYIMRFSFKTCNALFICGTFIYFMCVEAYPLRVLEALTYQGLLLLSIYTLCALAVEFFPKLKNVTTQMQNLSFSIALFISALSWGLKIPVDNGGLSTFKNHFFHTLNSLSCLVSMAFYKQVWCSKQCFVPLIYGIGYAAFAGTSQALGAEALYPFLDFKTNPEVAVLIILIAAVLIPALHLLLCLLSKYVFHRKKRQMGKRK